jgi:hypothetical protein
MAQKMHEESGRSAQEARKEHVTHLTHVQLGRALYLATFAGMHAEISIIGRAENNAWPIEEVGRQG